MSRRRSSFKAFSDGNINYGLRLTGRTKNLLTDTSANISVNLNSAIHNVRSINPILPLMHSNTITTILPSEYYEQELYRITDNINVFYCLTVFTVYKLCTCHTYIGNSNYLK